MPAPDIVRKIQTLIITADRDTLRGWAENWLNHVAGINPDIIQEEVDKALDDVIEDSK